MAVAYKNMSSYRDNNRMVTITRVSHTGQLMAQEISSDCPMDALQYSDIIQTRGGEINTLHQQKRIEELEKQINTKEEKKKQDLKNLVSYYLNRK